MTTKKELLDLIEVSEIALKNVMEFKGKMSDKNTASAIGYLYTSILNINEVLKKISKDYK